MRETTAMLTMRDTISTDGRRFGLVFLLIVLTGVCASVLMYWITGQGPGVTPDSTDYIEAARSLLAGNGFYIQGKAMTHYPPGYPLLLGGLVSFTMVTFLWLLASLPHSFSV